MESLPAIYSSQQAKMARINLRKEMVQYNRVPVDFSTFRKTDEEKALMYELKSKCQKTKLKTFFKGAF